MLEPDQIWGAYTALITPFRDGKLDEEAFRKIVASQVRRGIRGLVVSGTTGENPTLEPNERIALIRIAKEEAGDRALVIAGTGTNATSTSIEYSIAAKEAGADMLLLVAPYYNKPTQRGMLLHFEAITLEAQMPAMIYNVPGRCSVTISSESLAKLSESEWVVAVKDATGNLDSIQETRVLIGDKLAFFSGDDALTPAFISYGARGVVSVVSNLFPQSVTDLVTAGLAGEMKTMRQHHERLLPFVKACFVEPNPGPIKFAMSLAGYCKDEMRLPMVCPDPENQAEIRGAVASVGGV